MPPKTKKVVLSGSNRAQILGQTPPPFTPEELNTLVQLQNDPTYNENNENHNNPIYPITTALQNIARNPRKRSTAIQFVKSKLGVRSNLPAGAGAGASARSNLPTGSNARSNVPAGGCLNEEQTELLKAVGASVPKRATCATEPSRYKSCLILGHGSILPDSYTVVPEDLNVTFYSDKGVGLRKGNFNSITREYNINRSMPNASHHYLPNTMIMNMHIKLLTFFQKNIGSNGSNIYGNFTNKSLINFVGFSGIISKRKEELKNFMEIEDRLYSSLGVMDVREITNPNNHRMKIKLLHFGNHIYGYIHSNDPFNIMILNRDENQAFKNEIIDVFGLNKAKMPSRILEDEYKKIVRVSYIHHNTNIISIDELERVDYSLTLGTLLKHIETYNHRQSNVRNKITLCHGLMCRIFPTIFGNIATRSRANISEPYRLIRQKSNTANYKGRFGNIWSKVERSIQELGESIHRIASEMQTMRTNQNRMNKMIQIIPIMITINIIYPSIKNHYEEYISLNQKEYHFIMYLINKDIERIKGLYPGNFTPTKIQEEINAVFTQS